MSEPLPMPRNAIGEAPRYFTEREFTERAGGRPLRGYQAGPDRILLYKPCPFCGCDGGANCQDMRTDQFLYACPCGARGPARKTGEAATIAWNTRPRDE